MPRGYRVLGRNADLHTLRDQSVQLLATAAGEMRKEIKRLRDIIWNQNLKLAALEQQDVAQRGQGIAPCPRT